MAGFASPYILLAIEHDNNLSEPLLQVSFAAGVSVPLADDFAKVNNDVPGGAVHVGVEDGDQFVVDIDPCEGR